MKVHKWSKKDIKIVKNFTASTIVKNNLIPGISSSSIYCKRNLLKAEGVKLYKRSYSPGEPLLLIKENKRPINSSKRTVRFYTPEDDKIIMSRNNTVAAKLLGRSKSAIGVRRNAIKNGKNTYKFVNKNLEVTKVNPQPKENTTDNLNFRVSGVDVVIASNMAKKILITKDRIEILNK